MSNDMVKFLMPDGSEVSNDPRFGLEEAREEMLASRPNTGDVGITTDEQFAQTQHLKMGSLQSGQPGVGENATLDDPVKDAYGPLGSPAQQRQSSGHLPLDADKAKEAGGDAFSTTVEDPDPVDSNEAVLKVRAEAEKRREKAQKAQEDLGEEGPGDPDQPYSEWSSTQLKAEALSRNADRDEDNQLDLKGIRKKSALAELLQQDDDGSRDPESQG